MLPEAKICFCKHLDLKTCPLIYHGDARGPQKYNFIHTFSFPKDMNEIVHFCPFQRRNKEKNIK